MNVGQKEQDICETETLVAVECPDDSWRAHVIPPALWQCAFCEVYATRPIKGAHAALIGRCSS